MENKEKREKWNQDKFDITKHKNYKLLEDYDKKNLFNIEDYINRKGKAKSGLLSVKK